MRMRLSAALFSRCRLNGWVQGTAKRDPTCVKHGALRLGLTEELGDGRVNTWQNEVSPK